MPYNANIPQAADLISASQPPLLGNFQEISTFVNVNHFNFGLATQGKHKYCTFGNQAATPVPLADEINLFCRQSVYSLQPELTVSRNNGSVFEITTGLGATPGWAFTSSGMLLKWGQLTALAADYPAGTTLNFPVAATIPPFTGIFMVYLTVYGPGAGDTNNAATLKAFNNASITVAGSTRAGVPAGANTTFNYLAVGVP